MISCVLLSNSMNNCSAVNLITFELFSPKVTFTYAESEFYKDNFSLNSFIFAYDHLDIAVSISILSSFDSVSGKFSTLAINLVGVSYIYSDMFFTSSIALHFS